MSEVADGRPRVTEGEALARWGQCARDARDGFRCLKSARYGVMGRSGFRPVRTCRRHLSGVIDMLMRHPDDAKYLVVIPLDLFDPTQGQVPPVMTR